MVNLFDDQTPLSNLPLLHPTCSIPIEGSIHNCSSLVLLQNTLRPALHMVLMASLGTLPYEYMDVDDLHTQPMAFFLPSKPSRQTLFSNFVLHVNSNHQELKLQAQRVCTATYLHGMHDERKKIRSDASAIAMTMQTSLKENTDEKWTTECHGDILAEFKVSRL